MDPHHIERMCGICQVSVRDWAGGPARSAHEWADQGVRRLGTGLRVDATSPDGIIEAVRHEQYRFMVGVQWHPEFHDSRFPQLLPTDPLMRSFLQAADQRRNQAAVADR